MSKPNELKGAPSIKELASLIKSLKGDICDDYRCSDDPEDTTPGIQITIGANDKSWHYQTGDNSYSGGAYGYSHWGIGYIYRNSNSREVAKEVLEDLYSQLC